MIRFDYYYRGEEKTKMIRIDDVIKHIREGKYSRGGEMPKQKGDIEVIQWMR